MIPYGLSLSMYIKLQLCKKSTLVCYLYDQGSCKCIWKVSKIVLILGHLVIAKLIFHLYNFHSLGLPQYFPYIYILKMFLWNCIFGSFKLFPHSKIDFWPFLKLQKMEFGQKKNLWNWFIWFHEFFWPGLF